MNLNNKTKEFFGTSDRHGPQFFYIYEGSISIVAKNSRMLIKKENHGDDCMVFTMVNNRPIKNKTYLIPKERCLKFLLNI